MTNARLYAVRGEVSVLKMAIRAPARGAGRTTRLRVHLSGEHALRDQRWKSKRVRRFHARTFLGTGVASLIRPCSTGDAVCLPSVASTPLTRHDFRAKTYI